MILPTAYFAPWSWYRVFLTKPCQIEVCENFVKQTYRNRCRITSPNGKVMLSIPICKVEHKQITSEVEISYEHHWQHQHKIALLSAYKRTPYFDYYWDYIEPIYSTDYKYLKDLNEHCHRVVMSLINNERPQGVMGSCLDYTLDWQGYDLEAIWGDGESVLDLLMEYGPLAKQILQDEENRLV